MQEVTKSSRDKLSPQERLPRLKDTEEDMANAAMTTVSVLVVINFYLCHGGFLVRKASPRYSDGATFQHPHWYMRIIIGDVSNECVI